MKFLIKKIAIAKSTRKILDLKHFIYGIMNYEKFITNEL